MVRELSRTRDGLAAHHRLRRRPGVPGRRRGDPRRPRRARRRGCCKDAAREAAAQLAEIPYASMAIVTLAFRAADFPAQQRSGYLVPAVDGRAVKAATFSTVKWPHLAAQAPVHVVRCSVGRSGDVAVLQRDDEDLAALAAAELGRRHRDHGEERRAAGHPLGRRPAPVQRRPPGPRRRASARRWRGSPAWPSRAPPTTASASPRASPPRGPPPTR